MTADISHARLYLPILEAFDVLHPTLSKATPSDITFGVGYRQMMIGSCKLTGLMDSMPSQLQTMRLP